jgi:hypothetical protein
MRVTITVDDDLVADLKQRARAEGKSLSAVVSEMLRAQLGERKAPPKTGPFRLVTVKGRGVRPGLDVRNLGALEEAADIERWTRGRGHGST